ncbi:FecR family protein [Mariniphaga sediminis]|uniref:FecR family protein n=1 Tax=Mariniphaga sediminis TaxID=1628158 RepID=UPI00356401F8
MENTNKIANLVTGNIHPENKKKVLTEIHSNEESRKTFHKLKAAWVVFSFTKKKQDYEIEKSYLALHKKIQRHKYLPFDSKISYNLKYAAILFIVIGLPVLWYLMNQTSSAEANKKLKYVSVVADNGQMSKIILPDSSLVLLNSGTTLSYNSSYAITNRDLILKGQAYLQVKKDSKNPLTVTCNDLKVKVLGTEFDISAYPEDDKIQVVLETGCIQLLRTADDSFKYKLKPGEMAQYDVKLKDVVIEKVNTADYTTWKEGSLIFNDVPMADVTKRLERRFNIEIVVKDKEVYQSVFNANFKNEDLTEILEYIQYTCPIKYTVLKENNKTKRKIEFYYQPD